MESILELDQHEIKQIKKLLKEQDEAGEQLHQTFVTYAPSLFETAFQIILTSGAKMENLALLRQMAESEDDALQVKMDKCIEITLNLCAAIIKQNIRGSSEFTAVLNDLGIDESMHGELTQVFLKEYVARLEQINNVYEDNGEESSISQKYNKKLPLNVSMADEFLIVSNPRMVDVDWRLVHTISSKNLNKILKPRFEITLTMLT